MFSLKTFSLMILFIFSIFRLSASESVLTEVDRLISEKQYESAWTVLHEQAETLDFPDLIIKKTELSLRYFVLSNMHQMFAFTDLKAGQDLIELRKAQGQYDLKLFDPAGGLAMAIKQEPENPLLYYWKGEYYHEILTLYGDGWHKNPEELRRLIRENFEKALTGGMQTEEIYSKLGYTTLLMGDWEYAADYFNRALNYNREDPAYFHNLAIAQLNLEKLHQAEINAELAINLYEDSIYKADTCFLASTIALHRSRNSQAEEYLVRGFEYSPGDYRFPDRLIRLYLSQNNYDKARKASGDLFALYPENPATCTTIIQYFYNHDKLDECDAFFTDQLALYTERPSVMGNLYFHQAIAARYQGLYESALRAFDSAAEEFSRTYTEDHEVFGVIRRMKEEIKK